MFKIIHDLSMLSEAERMNYCRDFASYLGLNPDENRIDTIWMQDNNVRSLVAYCRRGTTDLLREIHNIDVTDMVKEDGPGYVSFKASGINRRGRKEIAVGAFATAFLAGDRLAAAVATAETRAGRRLTLKFVGGGLLDESEVSNTVITDSAPVAAPAEQPRSMPNPEVGKPVSGGIEGVLTGYMNDKLKEDQPDIKLDIVSALDAAKPVSAQIATPASEPAIKPAIPASVEAANAILAQDMTSEPIPAKKRGRPRKSKNTVDMGDVPEKGTIVPETGSPNAYIPENQRTLTSKLTYVPICPVCKEFMAADEQRDMFLCTKDGRLDMATKPSMLKAAEEMGKAAAAFATAPAPTPVAAPVPPPKAISLLTDVEQKQVKARLAPFWVDILPKGGMTADDGISIWGKLIKFANAFYADQPDYKKWPFAAWEVFFEFLDEYNAKNGAAALVEYINGKINAA